MHQAAASTSTKMTRASHHQYGEQVTFYLMVGDDRHITIAAQHYCCYYSNYRLQLPHFTWSGGFFFIVDDQLVKRETGGPVVRMYSCTPNPQIDEARGTSWKLWKLSNFLLQVCTLRSKQAASSNHCTPCG